MICRSIATTDHTLNMARKARGPNATSAKVDPSRGKGRKLKKMGLAEEVRTMLPKSRSNEALLTNTIGRKVSAGKVITLSTDNNENESEEDEDDEDFADKDQVLSEADDEELVPEDEEDIDALSNDELDGDEDSAQFSDSSEGSEAAEIDIDDLQGMEDVDALERTDLNAIDMPKGEALTKLQEELGAESSDESEEAEEFAGFEGDATGAGAKAGEASESNSEDEDEGAEIALSDVESDKDAADIVPVTRETINNVAALNAAYNRIALELPKQFSSHQVLLTDAPVVVPDVNDDLSREIEFYKQGLAHATRARDLIYEEGAAWERPSDYFAEMVKTDDHMERIRKELVQEATAKKASADAKKQRDLKKFGKQVQINKTLERAKEKKQTVDKIKALKRKRGATELEGKEDFDVALDEAVAAPDSKRTRGNSSTPRGGRGSTGGRGSSSRGGRDARDQKFGFGGKKRFAKSNTAESTYDMAGFNNDKSSRGRGGSRGGSSRGGRGGSRGGGRGGSSRGGSSRGGGSARPGKSKRH